MPLDVFIVRKLAVPDQPEVAVGAVASGGVRIINEDFHQVSDAEVERLLQLGSL